jgi:hypothetical protein
MRMNVRRLVLFVMLLPLVGCARCGKKPAVTADAGLPAAALIPVDAGDAAVTAAKLARNSPDRPYDFPSAPDAPDWSWPVVRVEKGASGKDQLHVIGWAEHVSNPSLAKVMAEARARTALLKVMQDKKINAPGFTNGEITGVSFPRTFQSSTGAFFVEAVMDVP